MNVSSVLKSLFNKSIFLFIFQLQVSISQLLYLLNFSCVICLPFIALLCGELPYLEKELLKRGALELIFSILILVSNLILKSVLLIKGFVD